MKGGSNTGSLPGRRTAGPHGSSLSSRVKSASVIGLGPALIAVSPEALERLTDDELDQVVLHEWAHVQRRDDYARLIQLAIRCIAGLHPAVWWIGRRLEIEREIACDDYAVNITGGARRLAVCLTKLADLQQGAAAATLAPGVLLASQLTQRVRRLLDPRRNTSTRGSARGAGIRGERADIRRSRARTCRARRRRIAGRRTHGRSARARDSLATPGVWCADSVRHGIVHARACDAAGDPIAGRASGSRLAGTIRRAECGVLRRAGAPKCRSRNSHDAHRSPRARDVASTGAPAVVQRVVSGRRCRSSRITGGRRTKDHDTLGCRR